MEKAPPSVFRIDEQVFYSMGVIAVISLLILGFRYKNYEPCEEINLTTSSANFYAKSLISFKAETRRGKRYEWYFGDENQPETGGSTITHEYKKPGRYTVNVKVNGKCEQVINVDIQEAPIVVVPDLIPQISGPDSALINVPVTFEDITPDATSWEWRFGNSKIIESNTRKASYTFTTEGHHEVYLRINGRFDRYTIRDVYVKDPTPLHEDVSDSKRRKKSLAPYILPPIKNRPEALPLDQGGQPKDEVKTVTEVKAAIEIKKVRDITPLEISDLLQEVVSGKKGAQDFAEFLCGDLNIAVKYNNETMTFGRMCNELKEFKRAKKINKPLVKLAKENATNCIKFMDVTVTKKVLLDRVFQ